MERIRILYVGAGPLINRGVEKYITQVVKRLDRNRFLVDVFTPNDCRNNEFRTIIENHGGKVIEGKGRETRFFREIDFYNNLSIYLKNNSYDIVEIQTGSITFLGLGIKASKKYVNDGIIAHTHNTQSNTLKAFVKKILLYKSLISANEYFACSEKAAYETFPKKIAKRSAVINNAIDISNFTYSESLRETIRSRYGIKESTSVFGCIGAFTEQKNHLFLLDVYREICNLKQDSILWLFGDGELRERIEKKIQQLCLGKNVVLFGNRGDVNQFYQAMDCCIIPSLFEGLCIVAIEGQAAGLPVVAANTLPDNVNITDMITFESLNKKPVDWAKKCLVFSQSRVRRDTSIEIRKAGYDIDSMVQSLSKKYSYLYERKINAGKGKL